MSDFPNGKRYHTYDAYLKKTFGHKCVKIPLDGGFTCPNRDGTKGRGGCVFCAYGGGEDQFAIGNQFAIRNSQFAIEENEKEIEGAKREGEAREAANDRRFRPVEPLRVQYERGRAALEGKWGRAPTIVYFQSYSSTYAPLEKLKALYEEALCFEDVVGLTIATRADALAHGVPDYLTELSHRTVLTVELGLQSVFDETSRRINRGHTYAEFLDGYRALKERGISLCVHLINGLPGEDREMMLESARRVAALRPDFVKFHELYIRRGAPLASEYRAGKIPVLTCGEYVSILASQIEMMPPETVIERLTGDPLRGTLIAPAWAADKKKTLALLDKTLAARGTFQGFCYKCTKN